VAFEIGWIIPVLCNDDNTIHSELFAAKRDGFTHCFEDRNVLRFAYFLPQQAFIKLMDVDGHHLHP
jgi:hypothetical protein